MYHCPQCGEETETLREGYCEPCRDERQAALNLHNAEYDRWQKMSDQERAAAIRRACNQEPPR